MSRHRNVRSMNYTDEYDGYDDVYGHSMEDDYTISPSDAAFMYDRNRQPQMANYLAEEDDIAEEDESGVENAETRLVRRDSETFQRPTLTDVDEARLRSCLDEIRNVIGDSISEQVLVNTVLKYDFNVNKSLDAFLSSAATSVQTDDPQTKRPREKKDTGKDQDVNSTPLSFIPESVIPSSSVHSLSVAHLTNQLATTLRTGPNLTSLPRFQFKTKPGHNCQDSSDDDDEQGSFSTLIAQHQKKTANQFSSLADLADQHLKTKPLLSSSPMARTNSTCLHSGPTNDVLAERFGQNVDNLSNKAGGNGIITPDLVVSHSNDSPLDLSCALKPEVNRRTRSESTEVDRSVSYESDFMDENVLVRLSTLHLVEEFSCAANVRRILDTKVPRRKVLSSFGKVVCRRWPRRAGMPYVPSEREGLSDIARFDFQTPSPDDVIKRHLRRK